MTGEGIAGPEAVRLALGGAAVALFTWWAVHDGGTAPGSWYPGALLFLAALVPVAYAVDPRRLSRPAVVALAALAAFTVWSFLSITWADARGDAWDGANRTLLYLLVFALFALLPWRTAEVSILLAAFALATAVAGAWALGAALAGNESGFADGRLAAPIGYENASAALLLAAFWPAVLITSARSTRAPVRGLLLAAAGLLLGLVVLCQSRGSLIAGPVALVVALALVRERRRLMLALSAVAVATLGASPFLLAVYAGAPALDDALGRAAIALVLSMALLAAAGLASARLDAHVPGPRPLTRRSLGAALACALVALAAGAGLAVAGTDDGATLAVGSRFTGGVESGRYDFWRVAWGQFARHPLQGAGADNFAQDYVRERRPREEPLYPHSIVFRTLGQTGMVGMVLLTAFFVAAFAGIRSTDALRGPPAVTALVGATAWLAHASLDWLWELPALAAPAMACLGLVAGLGIGPPVAAGRGRRPGRALAVAALAGAGAVSLALPALAARQIERAVPRFGDDPVGALQGLERARRLNPLSDRPDLIAGMLASQAGDPAAARRAFWRALARDADDWYPRAQLGVLDLEAGRRGAALAELTRARRLNPHEPAIRLAADAAQRGEPLPAGVKQRLSERVLPTPLGRRPLSCRPVLGLCARRPAA